MAAQIVGIRKFREKLASFLLAEEGPVQITRHGEPIGVYLPTKRRLTVDEIIENFKRSREEERMSPSER